MQIFRQKGKLNARRGFRVAFCFWNRPFCRSYTVWIVSAVPGWASMAQDYEPVATGRRDRSIRLGGAPDHEVDLPSLPRTLTPIGVGVNAIEYATILGALDA